MPTSTASRTSSSEALPTGTVALFANRFLPYSQTFIYDEIQAHTRYQIDVFCKERLNEDRFPYDRVIAPSSWIGSRIYENIAYWPRFDRVLSEGRHALIHAHFGTQAVYALPYVEKYDLPFAVTFHGIDVGDLFGPRRYLPRQWRYWYLSERIFEQADVLLCDSIELGELLIELGAPSKKIQVHRLGVDVSRFQRAEEEHDVPRITLVGRFTAKKGFTYALRACVNAIQSGSAAEVVILGDGELEPELRRIVHAGGIADHVDFRGAVPHDEVAHVLARSDIMMTPSVVTRTHDRDSGIVVAKEGSACEVPVIGTYHGGIPSIIDDGETGFLVPERNVDALTDRLKTLLDDATLRRSMGRAAREKMLREFDMTKQVEKLEKHYDLIRR
jgi:colanic acid/amylovoran biosynthesis glycosyltransferase